MGPRRGRSRLVRVVQSAGLIFFAYAGYARIATLGEEVREPRRTIPRAILIALLIAVIVYAAVALTTLATLGPQQLAASSAPVADAVATGSWTWAVPLVRVGAVAASLGALLALIAGIGRTTLAMARHADLPRWLAAVDPKRQIPAELNWPSVSWSAFSWRARTCAELSRSPRLAC